MHGTISGIKEAGNCSRPVVQEGCLRNENSKHTNGARNNFRNQGGRKLFQTSCTGRVLAELEWRESYGKGRQIKSVRRGPRAD